MGLHQEPTAVVNDDIQLYLRLMRLVFNPRKNQFQVETEKKDIFRNGVWAYASVHP